MRAGKFRIVQSGENYIMNNRRVSLLHNSYPDGATLTDTANAVVKNLLLCYTIENCLILNNHILALSSVYPLWTCFQCI